MILLDTSAVLFWAFAPNKLSRPAIAAIEESTLLIINAISLWEIGWKVKQGRLRIPISLQFCVSLLSEADRVEMQPTDMNIWLHSIELAWSHRDPADRVIVAAADLLGCPLITSDRRIREFYPLAIW